MSFGGARRNERELNGSHKNDIMVGSLLKPSLEELSEDGEAMVGSEGEGRWSAPPSFISPSTNASALSFAPHPSNSHSDKLRVPKVC